METLPPSPRPSFEASGGYADRLLTADSERAERFLEAAVRVLGVRRVYLEVLAPAQVQLGERFLREEINVAQHHLANARMVAHLERLARIAPVRGDLGRTAVVVALSGEHHTFGARMVADFLRFDGFAVDFLGGDTPAADLIDFVRRKQPDWVGISVTATGNLAAARRAAAGLKNLENPPKVFCGGTAVARAFGAEGAPEADGFAADAAAAVRLVRRLLGLDEVASSLESYLRNFGERVRELRRSRGWNQAQLAEAASLDRSYVSSLENGRHNLTVSVALKLSAALEVPLAWLLQERSG